MDETLHTLRTVHAAIVATSAAVLVLVVSPREADIYRAALRELQTWRHVRVADYRQALEAQLSSTFAQESILSPHELMPKGEVTANLEPHVALPTDVPAEPLESGSYRVATLLDVTAADEPVRVFVPDAAGRSKILSTTAGCAESDVPTLSEFRLSLNDEFSAEFYAECGNRPARVYQETISGTMQEVSDTAFVRWLVNQPEAPSLRRMSAGTVVWFPHVRALRDELGDVSLSEAARLLTSRVSAERRRLSLFGLEIDESLAVIAGPATLSLLMFYALAFLRHANTVFASARLGEITPAAWVGVMRGRLAGALTIVTLVILPPTAGFALTASSWPEDAITRACAVLIMVLLAGSSGAAGIEAIHLRREIARSQNGASPAMFE